jgi:hypothetical protein
MSYSTDYAVQIEIRDSADPDKLLARAPIEANFGPVLECRYLDRARRCSGDSLVLDCDDAVVKPVWNRELGEPFVQGFQAQLHGGRNTDVPLGVLANPTRLAVAKLLEQGVVDEQQSVVTLFTAKRRTVPAAEPSIGFEVEEASAAIPLRRGRLSEMLLASTRYDEQHSEGCDDLPVFVDGGVIDQACALTNAAGAAETGGILLGRLHRDLEPELYLEVTALIPARKAKGNLTQLEFTPECWSDVDAALRLRNRQEMMVGWFHSHPARHWCAECPTEKQQRCKLNGEFFSHHDAALHEAVFPRAFNVALVVSDSLADGLTWPLFGWRNGLVERRGYSIVGAEPKTDSPEGEQ